MPATPIVDCIGIQIFVNELHEPVALSVIERAIKRLGCVGDLAQLRGREREGVGSGHPRAYRGFVEER